MQLAPLLLSRLQWAFTISFPIIFPVRSIWNASFAGGSLVAAFMQGPMVGALVDGLPLADGHYVGSEPGWLSPVAVLCGIGLCVDCALLGACWLLRKCDGEARDEAYRLSPYLSLALLVFLAVVFCHALAKNFAVMRRRLDRPCLFVFSVIGALATIVLALSVRRRKDGPPFVMVAVIFIAAFGTLAISFWPCMIPFAITSWMPRPLIPAPHVLGERALVFPLMLLSTVIGRNVFRGNVRATADHY
jgi:cytochrome bd ubiquinol oxidase subunit II